MNANTKTTSFRLRRDRRRWLLPTSVLALGTGALLGWNALAKEKLVFQPALAGMCEGPGVTITAKTFEDCASRCLQMGGTCKGLTWDPANYLCQGFASKPDAYYPSSSAGCWQLAPASPSPCDFPPLCPADWKFTHLGGGQCAFTAPPSPLEPWAQDPIPLSPFEEGHCESACVDDSQCVAYTWVDDYNWCSLHGDWPFNTEPSEGAEALCRRLEPVEWKEDWSDCTPEAVYTFREYRCFEEGTDVRVADEQCRRMLGEDSQPVSKSEEMRPCHCDLPEELDQGEYLIGCEPGGQLEVETECELGCLDGYHLSEEGEDHYFHCDATAELKWPEKYCEPDFAWYTQPWGPCVDELQYRAVQCVEVATGSVVDDAECPSPMPDFVRECDPDDPTIPDTVTCCSAVGICTEHDFLEGYYCCGAVYTASENECCHVGISGQNESGCINTPDSGGVCDSMCSPW